MRRGAAILFLVAWAARAWDPESTAGLERSPAVYPQERITFTFSHRMHLRAGAKCERCHGAVARSDSARDRLVPGEPVCGSCHGIEAARRGEPSFPQGECKVCHPGFDHTVHRAPAPSHFPRAALVFSHARHLSRGTTCAECHGSYQDVELATRLQLPKMATCLGCHDGRKASARCDTCHLRALDAVGARIQTQLPGGELRPGPGNPQGLDHGARYDRTHGAAARARRTECLSCHAERSCLACHDGTQKPESVHPASYLSTHSVEARLDQPRCDSCHRRQSFCTGCHERLGLGSNADAPFYDPAKAWSIHPAGWLTPGPGHHGVQAARDIGQCASCHREEQCTRCHATSSALYPGGVRPHPPGFAAVCRDLLRKNDRACLKCHAPGEPSLQACR